MLENLKKRIESQLSREDACCLSLALWISKRGLKVIRYTLLCLLPRNTLNLKKRIESNYQRGKMLSMYSRESQKEDWKRLTVVFLLCAYGQGESQKEDWKFAAVFPASFNVSLTESQKEDWKKDLRRDRRRVRETRISKRGLKGQEDRINVLDLGRVNLKKRIES